MGIIELGPKPKSSTGTRRRANWFKMESEALGLDLDKTNVTFGSGGSLVPEEDSNHSLAVSGRDIRSVFENYSNYSVKDNSNNSEFDDANAEDDDDDGEEEDDDDDDENDVVGGLPEIIKFSTSKLDIKYGVGKPVDPTTTTTEEQYQSQPQSWTVREDLFADSPYFSAAVETEMEYAKIVTDTLREISNEVKILSNNGTRTANLTRNLSKSFRLGVDDELCNEEYVEIKRKAFGPRITSIFEGLGKCLEEIANAQESIYTAIEEALGPTTLESLERELEMANELKNDAIYQSEVTEKEISVHLNGSQGVSSSYSSSPGGAGRGLMFSQKIMSSTYFLSRKNLSSNTSNHPNNNNDNNNNTNTHHHHNNTHNHNNTTIDYSGLYTVVDVDIGKQRLQDINISQSTSEMARLKLIEHFVLSENKRSIQICGSLTNILQKIQTGSQICTNQASVVLPYAIECSHDLTNKRMDLSHLWHDRYHRMTSTLLNIKNDNNNHHLSSSSAADVSDLLLEEEEEENNINSNDGRKKVRLVGNAKKHNSTSSPHPPKKMALNLIEKETKFWEIPNVLAASACASRPTPKGVKIEGWLYKKCVSSFMSSKETWERQWFILKKGALYVLHPTNFTKRKICSIVLTTVRFEQNPLHRFCFQLVVPNERQPFTLKARGPYELTMWIDGIRSSIDKQLSRGDASRPSVVSKCSSTNDVKSRNNSITSIISGGSGHGPSMNRASVFINTLAGRRNLPRKSIVAQQLLMNDDSETSMYTSSMNLTSMNMLVCDIMDDNDYCAECNKPNPDWASLNLGILICLTCSGIHRSLGVHISKVRSLSLDSLSDREAHLLQCLGNDRMNNVWESDCDEVALEKPTPFSDIKTRENYIKNKYIHKKYVNRNRNSNPPPQQQSSLSLSNNSTIQQLEEGKIDDDSCSVDDNNNKNDDNDDIVITKQLFHSAKNGDVLGIASAIARGGDNIVNAVMNMNDKDKELDNNNVTAIQTCLFYCFNNNDVDNKDDKQQKQQNQQSSSKFAECVDLLLQNGATIDESDIVNQDALERLFSSTTTKTTDFNNIEGVNNESSAMHDEKQQLASSSQQSLNEEVVGSSDRLLLGGGLGGGSGSNRDLRRRSSSQRSLGLLLGGGGGGSNRSLQRSSSHRRQRRISMESNVSNSSNNPKRLSGVSTLSVGS